ncbi:MAG: [FeFe] hydrogenase H-cluster maturation GTPase HydF [Synergistales bacterium]|nr:[FeFe] hydrogenase H-cluster maturation GTPase HydF [Synergistales bacterium]MDY6400821.1 [FeFe] hydrogenase H-cluster maturation GTPase HydF [Synergistales bacterium]MDY6404009.1 [FeFe] hydrogenase H-cluster maturation GTPase HydF [Synergistales bacterium]MDY6410476.1 [FeFe] hydrogenase H-cluster maturation GTPase HydF [Synergistales bacterium]MDY6414614.1 [FeFe] hydrogenase H-cluster maturation GTPase HydF [Synergistales bacterium]
MNLNETPSGERVHIAFFGLRNAGKSSLVNAVTGQDLAVVSEIKGTTTDPVKKAMELLPLGPVLIIDTPGLDDEGTLGELRVKRALNVLANCDVAVLVHDAGNNFTQAEEDLIKIFDERKLPYIIANNKIDLIPPTSYLLTPNSINVSALTGENINLLKEKIAALAKKDVPEKKLISDLLNPGDVVVLVVPVDKAAPKGRLILPQQQTIRDILDAHCSTFICQDNELENALKKLNVRPKIVVTDSQVFEKVNKIVPENILLTSFSILFARYKGSLKILVNGAEKLAHLKDGDKILISEGCTHHRQCGDIGTEKIPAWIKIFTKAKPDFSFTSGGEFPSEDELKNFSLVIHCGGCMLNEQEMQSRIKRAVKAGVPVVNYGIAIAHMHGILTRSLEPFKFSL